MGSMRHLLLVSLLLVAAACENLPGQPTEAQRPINPIDVTDFGTLWGRHCAGCHGTDGKFAAARPLNDPLYLAVVSDAAMRRVVAHGVPGTAMPGFLSDDGLGLDAKQVELILAGMRERWAKGDALQGLQPPSYRGRYPGSAVLGGDVFARACASCHGADGNGGSVEYSVVDPSFLALVSDQSLRSTVIFGRSDLKMPDWRGTAGRPLSAQDVSNVVAWLAAHRVEFPGRPYPKDTKSAPNAAAPKQPAPAGTEKNHG